VIAGGYLVINHSGSGGTSATLNVPNVTVTTPAKK